MLKKLSERGDTIVEVLLAITVVSAVLSAAYVSTNRSLKANRAAQERTEALKIAEQQAERLKYLSANPSAGGNIFNTAAYCIKSDFTVQQTNDIATDTNCKFGERYFVSVVWTNASTPHLIRVLWENATGTSTVTVGANSYPGYDTLTMYYRVYQ